MWPWSSSWILPFVVKFIGSFRSQCFTSCSAARNGSKSTLSLGVLWILVLSQSIPAELCLTTTRDGKRWKRKNWQWMSKRNGRCPPPPPPVIDNMWGRSWERVNPDRNACSEYRMLTKGRRMVIEWVKWLVCVTWGSTDASYSGGQLDSRIDFSSKMTKHSRTGESRVPLVWLWMDNHWPRTNNVCSSSPSGTIQQRMFPIKFIMDLTVAPSTWSLVVWELCRSYTKSWPCEL